MRRTSGFSLLELVVVLSIFALVALIGVQVIQATVRSSDRLTQISKDSGELAVTLALLRQDLNAGLARQFTPANGGTEPALKVGPGAQFSLTVGGLARLNANVSGQGRVTWRLNGSGQLTRQVLTTLTPGPGRVPEVVVANGVRAMNFFSYQRRSGWQPGFAHDPGNPEILPLGLRVRLDLPRAEALDTVVSLR